MDAPISNLLNVNLNVTYECHVIFFFKAHSEMTVGHKGGRKRRLRGSWNKWVLLERGSEKQRLEQNHWSRSLVGKRSQRVCTLSESRKLMRSDAVFGKSRCSVPGRRESFGNLPWSDRSWSVGSIQGTAFRKNIEFDQTLMQGTERCLSPRRNVG